MSAVPDTSLGRRSIAEILLQHEYVTKEQVDEAVVVQTQTGRPLGQILVEAGTITRLELASALAEQWSDSGAPIGPPVGLSLSGSTPALEPFEARAATTISTTVGADLVSRLEAVEEALDRLGEEDDTEAATELREAIEAISEKVDALAANDGRDESLERVRTAVNELHERIEATAQTAESALQRSDDVAAGASAALERITEEVAAFSAGTSAFATGEDVDRLREVVQALSERPTRDADLIAQIEDLQAVVEALGERPTRDPDVIGQIQDLQAVVEALRQRPTRDVELSAQVDTIALHFAELGDRLDVLGSAVQSVAGDADVVHELESTLAELAQRPVVDPAFERRLNDLAKTVEELEQRPVADPEVEQRVESLAAALEDLRSTAQALSERPVGDPELDGKLFDLTSRLAELERDDALDDVRARLAEVAERPVVDPSVLQRLAELEGRIDGLPGDEVLEKIEANERSLGYRIDGVMARVDEVAATLELANDQVSDDVRDPGVSREAWEEAVALINSRIEVERELGARLVELEQRVTEAASNGAGAGGAVGADPKLAKQVAALSARVDQLAAGAVSVSDAGDGSGEAAVGSAPATLERDVEHVLMAIERLSVHLGAHERALTELMGSSGLAAQVRELSARVGDLETYGGGGSGESGGGGGGDGEMRAELRGLMRRLEDAESAQKQDRTRVIEQLEKAAGAIDWRLQRLETVRTDEPGS